jgi:hypothetical protein
VQQRTISGCERSQGSRTDEAATGDEASELVFAEVFGVGGPFGDNEVAGLCVGVPDIDGHVTGDVEVERSTGGRRLDGLRRPGSRHRLRFLTNRMGASLHGDPRDVALRSAIPDGA